jgi:disulfide bond formation protein DsbB
MKYQLVGWEGPRLGMNKCSKRLVPVEASLHNLLKLAFFVGRASCAESTGLFWIFDHVMNMDHCALCILRREIETAALMSSLHLFEKH